MIRRPPRFTRTDTLFPYTTRFRSGGPGALVVGDIDVTGGISSEFSLTVSASGQVAGATHDVTVGNISVALDMSSSVDARSEEHTSELQSLMRISYAVFCLKKKKHNNNLTNYNDKQLKNNHHN